jgi:hypothetical protein
VVWDLFSYYYSGYFDTEQRIMEMILIRVIAGQKHDSNAGVGCLQCFYQVCEVGLDMQVE